MIVSYDGPVKAQDCSNQFRQVSSVVEKAASIIPTQSTTTAIPVEILRTYINQANQLAQMATPRNQSLISTLV